MHVQMQKAILKVIADRGIKKCKEMFDEIVEVILGKWIKGDCDGLSLQLAIGDTKCIEKHGGKYVYLED